jgi:hypothetical protein
METHKRWKLVDSFDPLPQWSGGQIAGRLKSMKNNQGVVYHHVDGEKVIKQTWKTSNFPSHKDAYAHAYQSVYQYCKSGGFLLNEVRLIAPSVIEMKISSMTTTIFDHCMLEAVSKYIWHLAKPRNKKGREYVETRRDGAKLLLHRLLYDLQHLFLVKHVDGDGLNNLASNLIQKSKKTYRPRVPRTPGVYKEQSGHRYYWTASWTEEGKYMRRRFRVEPGKEHESKSKAIWTRELAKENIDKSDSE